MPISIAVDLKKHETNDVGSEGLKNNIELFDAVEEGVIKSENELIYYNSKEPEILGKKSQESVRQFIQNMAETNKDWSIEWPSLAELKKMPANLRLEYLEGYIHQCDATWHTGNLQGQRF